MADISKVTVGSTTYNIKDSTARTHINNTDIHTTAAEKSDWNSKVPSTRTVNGKALSSDIDLMLYDLAPTMTKTYTDVIGTGNNWAGATFFWGSIKPTSWTALWEIKFYIKTYVPGKAGYEQESYVIVSGSYGSLRSYVCWNNVNAYNVTYYYELYRMKEAGFNNGYGHALGSRFYSSNNPIDSNYKRTIEIEIYETKNCTFTFFDSCLAYASIPGTGSTNYDTYSEMYAAGNGMQETGDSNDVNYQNRVYYTSRKAKTALYRYQICFTTMDNKILPVNTVNNSTSVGKTLTTESFDPFGEIYYYNTTTNIATDGNIGNAVLYRQVLADFRYSFNIGSGSYFTAREPVYIKATPQSDGSAKLDATTPLVQALPNSEDGSIYIYLGQAYEDTNPYRLELMLEHPVYWYHDGAVRLWTGNKGTKILHGDLLITNPYNNASISNTDFSISDLMNSFDKYDNIILRTAMSVQISGVAVYICDLDLNMFGSNSSVNGPIGFVGMFNAGDAIPDFPIVVIQYLYVATSGSWYTSIESIVTGALNADNWNYAYEKIIEESSNWDTAYSNSHTHSNKSALDAVTSTKMTNWDTAYSNSHTHSNKSALDAITSTKMTNWDNAATNSHTHSNKTVLDGISSANISSWNAAEPNVQADWSTTDSTSDAFIKNKPSIPTATTTTPKMNGTAAVGTETTWAKGDHVHPVDTSRAASSHSHGNITSGGDMTATAAIASGDRIVINDESASKLTSSTLTFGTSTTQYLANNGTWQNVPSFTQVQADWSTTDSSAASYIANKPELSTLAETAELSDAIPSTNYQTVSQAEKDAWNAKSTFSGNYSDLNGKPTIPTTLAQLAADTTHRVVTDAQINQWNNNYTLPSSGIPLNDLSQPVRDLLTNKTSLFESDIIIGDVYFKRYAAGRLMVSEVE